MTLDLVHRLLGAGGHALLLATVAGWLARRARPGRRAAAAALGALLVAVPIGNLTLAGYLRGALGDLSVMTLLLLARALVRVLAPPAPCGADGPLWLGIAVTAVVFYPTALGLTGWDPYALGYRPRALLVVVGGLALAALRGWPAVARLVALSVIAFDLGLLESSNLWDYLLDPALALYALGRTVAGWWPRGPGRGPELAAAAPVASTGTR
jgi:hypothetical protein